MADRNRLRGDNLFSDLGRVGQRSGLIDSCPGRHLRLIESRRVKRLALAELT